MNFKVNLYGLCLCSCELLLLLNLRLHPMARDAMNRRLYKGLTIVETAIYRVFVYRVFVILRKTPK
ncbi:hypothetical protein [Nostoc sp. NZL]|uniref:hypothetical protein n=1 Tax=Nostoc sp. NZL TaxID=2650612 RepID=UPI0018C46C8E|nr:hypothetical protein [Nostoc sp. NZL]